MRRMTVTIGLAVLAALLLSSCGKSAVTAARYTPSQIAEAVITSQEEISPLQPLLPDDDYFTEYVSGIYKLDAAAIESGAIYYAGGMQADEIAVFRLADSSKADTAKDALAKYKDRRADAFMGYAPEQSAIIENGIVVTYGDYVALLICRAPQTARSVFIECFSENPPRISSTIQLVTEENGDGPSEAQPGQEGAPSVNGSGLNGGDGGGSNNSNGGDGGNDSTGGGAGGGGDSVNSGTGNSGGGNTSGDASNDSTGGDASNGSTGGDASNGSTGGGDSGANGGNAGNGGDSGANGNAGGSGGSGDAGASGDSGNAGGNGTGGSGGSGDAGASGGNAGGGGDSGNAGGNGNSGGTGDSGESNSAETPDQPDVYDPASILLAWRSGDMSGLSQKNRDILEACSVVIAELITADMSVYEKELVIHDWIIARTDYDQEANSNSPNAKPDPDNDNPYGAIFQGKSICSGYTSTFQLFMDMLGIECISVHGRYNRTGEEHAWNMVRIDGEWYFVDVTWDDPIGNDQSRATRHRYFNVTTRFMEETRHEWDESATPVADAGKLYYD